MAACFYKKALAVSSAALSVVSTIVSFVPFIAIYYIIQALVLHMNSLDTLNGSYMVRLGWLAGCGAIAAVFLNFVALMCSLAAFKTLYQLKLAFTQHIASLPLGFHTANSTGKLRKIVDENIEKIEGFIAHQLPAMMCSFTTPIVALVILFLFDWRMALALFCVLPISVALVTVSKKVQNKLGERHVQTKLNVSDQVQEYLDGMKIVKSFGLSGEKSRVLKGSLRNMMKEAIVFKATASLDPENEVLIQKAISELVKGRTVIVIVHRLKTIADADKMVVLDEGKVAKQGTYQELMEKNGLYKKLFSIQQDSLGWSVGAQASNTN